MLYDLRDVRSGAVTWRPLGSLESCDLFASQIARRVGAHPKAGPAALRAIAARYPHLPPRQILDKLRRIAEHDMGQARIRRGVNSPTLRLMQAAGGLSRMSGADMMTVALTGAIPLDAAIRSDGGNRSWLAIDEVLWPRSGSVPIVLEHDRNRVLGEITRWRPAGERPFRRVDLLGTFHDSRDGVLGAEMASINAWPGCSIGATPQIRRTPTGERWRATRVVEVSLTTTPAVAGTGVVIVDTIDGDSHPLTNSRPSPARTVTARTVADRRPAGSGRLLDRGRDRTPQPFVGFVNGFRCHTRAEYDEAIRDLREQLDAVAR